MSRYDGKPFLRFIDSYVLAAIGALDENLAAGLAAAEPVLFETFGVANSWIEVVAREMDFADDFPEEINRIWSEGSARACAAGIEVDPFEFTQIFVDTNFPFAREGLTH